MIYDLKVQDLNTDVADMTAESLNFWEVNYLMENYLASSE